jgi:L-ascorbate metabolism protein UlaG (beta-lactamase superfamily)
MALHFSVLASGSAGNASLLEADGFGVLIDAGLGPRQLASRLSAVGASWHKVRAVVLTHTHSDHWNDRTLVHLCRHRIPLYCHAEHHADLSTYGPGFAALRTDGLVRPYEPDVELSLAPGLRCRPLPIRHDRSMTCGFRFEAGQGLFGGPSALAYAADLGCWGPELAQALADVDVLALEFNHDVAMLHLSRDCNRPALAAAVAAEVLAACTPLVEIHTALQDEPGPCLIVGDGDNGKPRPRPRTRRPRRTTPAQAPAFVQPWLPGWETPDGGEPAV